MFVCLKGLKLMFFKIDHNISYKKISVLRTYFSFFVTQKLSFGGTELRQNIHIHTDFTEILSHFIL